MFDKIGRRELHRVNVVEQTDQVWHCYLPEARPGLLFGYRVHGPYEPAQGFHFNHHKLLLDPYAKLIVGDLKWSDSHCGYRVGHRLEDLSFDRRDSAPGMLKSMVIDPAFTWGTDQPPRIPWHKSAIYEVHVKGFTTRHPHVPAALRGTYAGLATAPVIDHLLKLGVTAIELMPVHYSIDDRQLVEKGLRNYWGYNSIGFFALLRDGFDQRVQDQGENHALGGHRSDSGTSCTTIPLKAISSGRRSPSAFLVGHFPTIRSQPQNGSGELQPKTQ